MTEALSVKNITKAFPGVVANDNISLSIEKGTIRAIVGENGAGKTTLMNIIYGLYQPDSGQIFIDNKEVTFASPRDAITHGIGMVHQHFKLVPSYTLAQNIALGVENVFDVEYDVLGIPREDSAAPGRIISVNLTYVF